MLTVNLLAPPRVRHPSGPLLTAGVAAVSIVLVGLAIWSYILTGHVNQLRGDLARATHEAAQLRHAAGHVQELKRNAERVRGRRDLLQQLVTAQMPASQILETIESVIPSDAWLTSVTVGMSEVTFEGYTFSYPSVARFMVELDESGSVRHANLAISQMETILAREVLKFRITGDLVVTSPLTSQRQTTP